MTISSFKFSVTLHIEWLWSSSLHLYSVGSVPHSTPQHHNGTTLMQTQSRNGSTKNVNWNLIAFQWKLMLQKMFATWRPQRNNLLQFILPCEFSLRWNGTHNKHRKESARVNVFSTSFLCSANMWRVTTTISFYVFLYKPRANIDESFKMNEQIADGEMEQDKKSERDCDNPGRQLFFR